MALFFKRVQVLLFMLIFLILGLISNIVLLVIYLFIAIMGLFTSKPLFWFQDILNKISLIQITQQDEVVENKQTGETPRSE